jgi:hypothetical protein
MKFWLENLKGKYPLGDIVVGGDDDDDDDDDISINENGY